MVYALDRHDAHVVRVREPVRLVCIFNPPLTGGEKHDARGGYQVPE
jgi:L-ectoine synthase